MSLGFCLTRVGDQDLRKVCAKLCDKLRGECDFGHQYDDASSRRYDVLRILDINGCFAASRHTVQNDATV